MKLSRREVVGELGAALMLPQIGFGANADARWGGVFLSEARLQTLRGRVDRGVDPQNVAFRRLMTDADASLTRQPVVPKDWYVPGYYRDAVGHARAKGGLAGDANAAYGLALAYRMTGDVRYARAAARIIDAWAAGVETMSTKDDSMLSFSYHFPALILAAGLLDTRAGWAETGREAFRTFVQTKALPMNTMARENNWGNWGLVLVMASAAYLRDRALFDRGMDRWKEFIETQIAEDGHLKEEVGRNNGVGEAGLWYSSFSLMPQTIAAEIARVNGAELYEYRSPSGRTLRLAFETLIPWVKDPSTFPYYKGDVSKMTNTSYVSYWEILNARWPNAVATEIVKAKRPMTADHTAPYLTFTHGDLLKDG